MMHIRSTTQQFDTGRRSSSRSRAGVGLVVLALLPACSKPVATEKTDVFLQRFDPATAECIRATVKPAILESLLASLIEAPAGSDISAKLSVLSGCASSEDLLRGAAHVAVEMFPHVAAPYGIGATVIPKRTEDVEQWMSAYPFDLAGRSRYRGVERRLAGRYMVAYRDADGSEPVHELLVEDVRESALRPEGWRADDVVGSLVLEAGSDSVEHGREKNFVWVVLSTGTGEEARKKVVWGAVGGPMVFSLEGSEDELMTAMVAELALQGRS